MGRFECSCATTGDANRGVSVGTQKGPNSGYRYRYNGTQTFGTVTLE